VRRARPLIATRKTATTSGVTAVDLACTYGLERQVATITDNADAAENRDFAVNRRRKMTPRKIQTAR
jgi:hypothetical protein